VIFLLRVLLSPLAFLLGSLPDHWFDPPDPFKYERAVEAVGDTFLGYVDGPPERLRDFAIRHGLI
jgi:hypothetical protein